MSPIMVGVWGIVPSLLLIWYFHSRDVHPEPQKVVWMTFGLMVFATLPLSVVALLVHGEIAKVTNPYGRGFLEAFVQAGFVEELFKFLVVVGYASKHKEFDEPMDGIVYGVVAALGFSTVENIEYILQGGVGVAILRALVCAPGHAFLGAIMGYYVGQAKFGPRRERRLMFRKALIYPALLHGLYDFPLLAMEQLEKAHLEGRFTAHTGALYLCGSLVSFGVLLTVGTWAIRLTRRLRREQLTLVAEAEGRAAPSEGVSRPVGWFLVSSGGILASLGGMIVLALIASIAKGVTSAWSADTALELLGLVPLLGGLMMFAGGMERLRSQVGEQLVDADRKLILPSRG